MTPAEFTEKVCEAYAPIENERLRALIQSLIQHLHTYVKENHLTPSEWEQAWAYFARMAEFTSKDRNEFLLAADILGVSQLVELLNHNRAENEVGYALVGPFFRANAPFRPRGTCIASEETEGPRVKISGRVLHLETGKPIAHATLNIWQTAPNDLYENQDPDQPDMNLRGQFTTDDKGTYELIALMPAAYPVPADGPAGELLSLAKRHPLRPAHLHVIVSAPGFETLITQVFVGGDKLIDTDVVFTASPNMVGRFVKEGDHYQLSYDFQLKAGVSTYPVAPIH